MGFKSILNRLLAVGLFALAVLRVEYAIAFGRGTSHNQVLVSPLAVTTHFAMVQKEHLPPQVQHFVEKFVVAMAIPGEIAIDEGIIPPTKMKKVSKSNKPKTLEIRAREWVAKQKNSKAMAAFVDENTFVISGALICFFSMLLAPMFPNDAFQNHLVGLSLFWFGANGAHGAEVQFSIAFMVMIPLLLFVVFILYDGPTAPSKAAVEKKKAKADAAAEKKKNDDWDDGIGGISMADIRARKEAGGACNDGCCG